MKYLLKMTIIVSIALVSCVGYLAWRAHTKLVTLHLRNAPLARVVSSLRWQTWESFLVNTNVTGAVTLDVEKMPLEQVLTIIGEQLNARWATVYPIYRDKTSLVSLRRALRGEVDLATAGFTSEGGSGLGFRGEPPMADPRLVTLHLTNTDLTVSALALERSGSGRVLVEKSANAPVNLELANLSFESAVKTVAQSAHRKTARFYALQPSRNPAMLALARGGSGERPGGPRNLGGAADASRMEKMQQVLQTLPEDEQKRAEERQAERAAMQSLTPEQRQQVMADRMNSPEMQARGEQRSVSGIKNTTPEQRHERFERMYEMRKARAATTARR